MNPCTGRLCAILLGLLPAVGAHAAYPDAVLAVLTGRVLDRDGPPRPAREVVRRRGSLWADAHGGLSSLAAFSAFAVVASLSLPLGLGVANAMTGVGVEMTNEGEAEGEGERVAGRDDAAPGASAVSDEGANAATSR